MNEYTVALSSRESVRILKTASEFKYNLSKKGLA